MNTPPVPRPRKRRSAIEIDELFNPAIARTQGILIGERPSNP